MLGIILAGGRATRLGPLAAQLNKSLVTVGQKPMLVRQVQQLRAANCDHVVVVVSPDSRAQVNQVLRRAGFGRDVATAVQELPTGPGGALLEACRFAHTTADEPVLMLMADTVLADADVQLGADEVAVAPAPAERSFCVHTAQIGWVDAVVQPRTPVFVGAACFSSRHSLYEAVATATADSGVGEAGMAPVLNAYDAALESVDVTSWQDVGDPEALARAQREAFISRPFNALSMPHPGVVVKRGGDELLPQANFLRSLREAPQATQLLFPRFLGRSAYPGEVSYSMEHVDLPSLAELFLYWPSRPDMWHHVGTELYHQLKDNLWLASGSYPPDLQTRAYQMYERKLSDRYFAQRPPIPAYTAASGIRVNGRRVLAGEELVNRVITGAEGLIHDVNDWAGVIHGDPNFTNVLWSIRTGSFKLLDPRGSWGATDLWGDTRYDLGKIAYSTDFAPIAHGLFELHEDHGVDWRLTLPDRRAEEEALDAALPLTKEHLELLRAYLLLSSAPLHEPGEANALYLRAAERATDLHEKGYL